MWVPTRGSAMDAVTINKLVAYVRLLFTDESFSHIDF